MCGIGEQRQRTNDVGVARTDAILAQDRISMPVITDFRTVPMAANNTQPLLVRSLRRQHAGDEVAFQLGFFTAGLVEEPAGDGQQRPAVGNSGFTRFQYLDADLTRFDTPSDIFDEGKKGVRSRRDCASSYNAGWFPLTWSTYSPF